jgi:outer membrane protein assembly factor BamB
MRNRNLIRGSSRHSPIAACLLGLAVLSIPGATRAEDWPHWRGPSRNDLTAEGAVFVDGEWNLQVAWRTGVGEGGSSPVVVGDRLYTMGWRDGQDFIMCLDAADGKTKWEKSYKAPQHGRLATGDEGLYSGPSSTPEYDAETGLLYSLGSNGDLYCWNTRQEGAKVWHKNLYDEYKAPQRAKVNRSARRDYGYTSSPLVHEKWLIVEVGAPAGTLIAFDKRTGAQAWASQCKHSAGHSGGPAPLRVDGVPCVAVHNFEGLLVARLDPGHEGETVAEHSWRTEFANNIASVSVVENNVLLTSAYNHQKIARFRISLAKGAEKVWETPEASSICTPLIHAGHVYWSWRELFCLDFETGAIQWRGGQFGDAGSIIHTADDRLILWTGRGDLSLVESAARSPDRYSPIAVKRGIGRDEAWPHVVLANGRLFCRDRTGMIVCFVVGK